MQVQKVVNDVMSSATYVIMQEGDKNVWLVDCGSAPKIMECLEGKTVTGVLLTHTHYDHLYGLETILKLFPTCRVFTNQEGVVGLSSTTLNLSKYFDDPIIINEEFIEVVKEGDKIELYPGVFANVFETPGHNPSCLCFKIDNFLFTGDSYIPGFKPVTNFHGADKEMAKISYERVQKIAESLVVCPGHA